MRQLVTNMMAPEHQVTTTSGLGAAIPKDGATPEGQTEHRGRRGQDRTPRPGYVLKTRHARGHQKVFVNVRSDQSVAGDDDGGRWAVPRAVSGPRKDVDKAGRPCEVYDVVFCPGALARADADPSHASVLHAAALDAAEKAGRFSADRKRLAFPRMKFKGAAEEAPEARVPRHAVSHQEGDASQDPTRPGAIVVDIDLPEMTSAETVTLDVEEKKLTLTSTVPERYHLDLNLDYPVDKERGVARFDKSTRRLVVHLPVRPKSTARHLSSDSGVDVDEGPDVFKDDDAFRTLSDESRRQVSDLTFTAGPEDSGLEFPTYTCNIYDELMVLKLDVKNVEEASLVKDLINADEGCGFSLRFTTKASEVPPVNFGFDMIFLFNGATDEACAVEDLEVEVWDNNIIVQMPMPISDCTSYKVGNCPSNMKEHGLPQLRAFKRKRKEFMLQKSKQLSENTRIPASEQTLLQQCDPDKERHSSGDSAISVNDSERCSVRDSSQSDDPKTPSTPTSLCGILKWPAQAQRGRRCFSESDQLTMMMSMASISSFQSGNSSIPEEQYESCGGSSVKKSVRFSEVVQRQVFRTNSSILGRRIKNLKKSEQKKRKDLERRRSEGDSQHVDPMLVQSKSWTSLSTDQNCNEDSGMASSMEDCTLMSKQNPRLKYFNSGKKGGTPGDTKNNGFSKEANLDLIFELDF